jgi:hypothetical protein
METLSALTGRRLSDASVDSAIDLATTAFGAVEQSDPLLDFVGPASVKE